MRWAERARLGRDLEPGQEAATMDAYDTYVAMWRSQGKGESELGKEWTADFDMLPQLISSSARCLSSIGNQPSYL